MGAVEAAVDAAASFVGPFVDKAAVHVPSGPHVEAADLVAQALHHLHSINAADLAADPNAPYDASLAGVVYALLDLVTSLGILAHLPPAVAFSQRPRSVLTGSLPVPSTPCEALLAKVVRSVIPILNQPGTGVQPLLSQRILPDVVCALANLSFSPHITQQTRSEFVPLYHQVLSTTPTPRLLPILTTLLQQPLPAWLKPYAARELTLIPLRPQGIRHVTEFLSLSALSNSSEVPQNADGLSTQAPIPLEAIAQAARLLVLPPVGMDQDRWIRNLEPQLWTLLDGGEGREMSRAAGHIIAAGILSKKATGAPGAVGWQLFALPLLRSISPIHPPSEIPDNDTKNHVLVQDQRLLLAMKRLSVIVSAHSHAGLIKRLVGPLLLPLWALLNHVKARRVVNQEWAELPQTILSRYMVIVCDPAQIDLVTKNLFWDGTLLWSFGAGSQGGIEVRLRNNKSASSATGATGMGNILSRIGNLDKRVQLLISLLDKANIPDDTVASIFVQVTKRWLAPGESTKTSLTDEPDTDPLAALVDAKLSEALANTFQANFARCPQHIVELMCQILQNYVAEHKREKEQFVPKAPSRANLRAIVRDGNIAKEGEVNEDTTAEDLVSFAMSILSTMLASSDFEQSSIASTLLPALVLPLQYLSRPHKQLPMSSVVSNSATNLLQILGATQHYPSLPTKATNSLVEHRATLKAVLSDLTSPEPPNRTWALSRLRKLIRTEDAFPIIDIPSTTHLLLSASLADDESYVHTAAVPVLVDLAVRAENPVVKILVDSFLDVEERSLKPTRGKKSAERDEELLGALDFRLRVGEVLSKIGLDDAFWSGSSDIGIRYASLRHIVEACLSLASRRGQRHQTFEARQTVLFQQAQQKEEAEAAWGGPIPNLLGKEGESSDVEDKEREALLKVVKGWEETGVEEDVRIRASAMSVLGTVLEKRLEMVSRVGIDASLQTVLLVLTVETSMSHSILRRAAVLVIMGVLRAIDLRLEAGHESSVDLDGAQQDEVGRVMRWARDEDSDVLVREHAASVVEGLETLAMKKLYRIRDQGLRLGADLGLEGPLRGLDMQPLEEVGKEKRTVMVEEIE